MWYGVKVSYLSVSVEQGRRVKVEGQGSWKMKQGFDGSDGWQG